MKFSGLCGLVCLLLIGFLGFSANAFTARDANTVFSAYNSDFYFQKGTNAYFKDTQTGNIAYFWGQAEMIETVIDAYEWNTNATAQIMITNLLNGFIANNGSSWTYNVYNDDILWAVIAFARGGRDTDKMSYCAIAKNNFDAVYARAWDSKLGGGLYWRDSDRASKNACVNGPGAIAAYLLYQIYGDASYLTKANNIYNWEKSVLFNTNSGAIYDNIGTNGVISTWSSTYNQGTFLGAADFLGQYNDAQLAINFTMMDMTSGGILPEYGIAGNNSGFNAIFLRWMTKFMKDRNLQNVYEPWLQTNASAAWNIRRPDNLSWCQWLHPSPSGTNFYSWDCISSFSVLQAADPTESNSPQAVATDYIGYWPLDGVTLGTTPDTSGCQNKGTVNNAGASSSGRINGCLVFNGATSSVQITNAVGNDFSIAFWVKTTQLAGSGQWYNGVGLVDGDAAGVANDFGVAMCGGKLAIGIGNPDTTFLSSRSINDGAWHFCVATRQQATGIVNLYIDGSLQTTGTASKNTLNSSAKLLFGAIASGGGHFNGSLDEIQIFSRALSADEIVSLYQCNNLAPPSSPANLNAVTGNAQVSLNWAAAPWATSYNVKRSQINGGPYLTIANVASTAFTDSNALNNQTYYYVVSSVNGQGESTNSNPVSVNTTPLVAWFKADAIEGLVNGAAVSLWPDLTGNGYNALQTLSSQRPTYVTGAINGLPAVHFNSANNNYLWFYRPVQDDFTMIAVFRSTQGVGTGTDFWSGAGLVNGEQAGAVNDFGISLNANGAVLAGTGNPDTTVRSGNGYNNSQPHVVTFKRIKSSGTITLYVDGNQVAVNIAGKQSLTSPNILALGAQATLNNFLNGDIAEVQIYNAALSDTDRTGLERALKCKYGLSGAFTPLAPAGLTGTAGNREISLRWTLVAGAASYDLWRSTNGGASFQLAAGALTNSGYVDTNAVNGLVNYYRLTATDDCGAGSYSAVASISLPLPALGMAAESSALSLTWPGWAADWKLYFATNLTPPVVWFPVTNAISTNNGQFNLTLPVNSGTRFFRLAAP